jgi:hypothetical protein
MNPDRRVYDNDHDEKPVTKPDLRALEGGKEPSEPRQGHLSLSGSNNKNSSRASETGSKSSKASKGPVNKLGLSNAEGKDFPGQKFAFNSGLANSLTGAKVATSFLQKHRRKALIGGGLTTGLIGIIISLVFLLIPLKIENIVTNLQNRFFSTSDNAVSNETDTMFTDFMEDEIAPAMSHGKCSHKGTEFISKDCTLSVSGNGNNPVTNLYKTWSQAKLENDLADKYNIELVYSNKDSGTFYLKAPGIEGDGEKVGDAAGIDTSEFAEADRGTIRQAFKDAEKDMTNWDKVMFRYKVGRLLEEKYGIKRCIAFCGTQDAFTKKASDKKYAAKAFLIERVENTRLASMSAVLECLLNNSCDNPEPATVCAEDSCGELAGKDESVAEGSAEVAAGKASSLFGEETASKLIANISDIRDAGGPEKYAVQQVLSTVGIDDGAGSVVDGIGVISTAGTIAKVLKDIGPASVKLSYITNSGAAVSLFEMYRTYADEIHTGHVDPTEVGSFTDSLGPGSQCATAIEGKCGTQLGGTASAEATPLYGNLMDGSNGASTVSTASLISSILPSKASADSTAVASNDYKCSGGSSVPAGQLVCPEEELGRGNPTAKKVSAFVSSGPVGYIFDATADIGGIAGKFTGIFGGILSSLGLGNVFSFVTKIIQPFFTDLINQVIPSPIGPDMSGGRTFDMMAAGADVAGNDYAHTGLGGGMVSATQAATVASNQASQAQKSFSQEPFFARMFSTASDYSLISQVADDMPFGLGASAENSFSSLISDPFSVLTHGFSSLFSTKVNAAVISGVVNGNDAFGITQYEPATVPDPTDYWNANCNDNASDAYQNGNTWNTAAATVTDAAGMPENTTTNPCLLIEATVGSAGGEYNTSLLSTDDLADVSGSTDSTTTTTSGCSTSTNSKSYYTTTGAKICDTNGNQFIPYGISIIDDLDQSDWTNSQYQAATDAQIQAAAKNWNINNIRIQVSETNFMDSPTAGLSYNLPAMQRLQTEVNEILNLGKVPIINDNLEQTDSSQTAPTARTEAFWVAVANYLSQHNQGSYNKIIFDIFNEPSDISPTDWQSGGDGTVGMQAVIDAIRGSNNNLSDNLIFAEGPDYAQTIALVDQYPLTGGGIVYDYHHVDFTQSTSTWESAMGLDLTTSVPIVDGEWAQYAKDAPECYPNAPEYVSNYLQVLKDNNIGLIMWSLAPGVGIQTSDPIPGTSRLNSSFPTTIAGYSTPPTTFSSNYSCTGGVTSNLIGQGAGSDVMQYFDENNSTSNE